MKKIFLVVTAAMLLATAAYAGSGVEMVEKPEAVDPVKVEQSASDVVAPIDEVKPEASPSSPAAPVADPKAVKSATLAPESILIGKEEPVTVEATVVAPDAGKSEPKAVEVKCEESTCKLNDKVNVYLAGAGKTVSEAGRTVTNATLCAAHEAGVIVLGAGEKTGEIVVGAAKTTTTCAKGFCKSSKEVVLGVNESTRKIIQGK